MIADQITITPKAPQPEPTAWLRFNINETVRVKLLPPSVAELKRQHDELCRHIGRVRAWVPPALDADGFYVTQLWCLMESLGHLLTASGELPFEVEIQIKASDVRP